MKQDEEYEFLVDVGNMEMNMVARKWGEKKGWETEKSLINTYAWLGRIRKTLDRERNHINRILALQRKNARIRKLTISGSVPEKDDEEF